MTELTRFHLWAISTTGLDASNLAEQTYWVCDVALQLHERRKATRFILQDLLRSTVIPSRVIQAQFL